MFFFYLEFGVTNAAVLELRMGQTLRRYLFSGNDPDETVGDIFFAAIGLWLFNDCSSGLERFRKKIKWLSTYKRSAEQWKVERLDIGDVVILVHRRASSHLVVWVHGGGFVAGHAEDSFGIDCFDSLRTKYGTDVDFASIEYRLAPEHPYPTAVDDCKAALQHCLTLGYATLSVAGCSAGANLALAAVLKLGNVQGIQDLAILYPFLDPTTSFPSFHIHGQRANFGDWLKFCWRAYYEGSSEDSWPSLLKLDREHFAPLRRLPILVVTGRADPLHDEGVALVNLLRDSGVADVRHVDGRGGHAMMHLVDPVNGHRMFLTWATFLNQLAN